MALTEQEKAFYESFLTLLNQQGIDAEHAYRLTEVIAVEDYIGDDEETEENIVEPAMFERDNDSHIGRNMTSFVENNDFEYALSVFQDPAYAEKISEASRERAIKNAAKLRSWLTNGLKNPFDAERAPSENLIKNLYRAYKENRLGLFQSMYINTDIKNSPNNICFIYEDKDGSMKLSDPSHEIESRYPFPISIINDGHVFYNNLVDDAKSQKLITERFGKDVVESLKPLEARGAAIPKKPGFFTKVLAVFGHKSSKAKVNSFNRYDAATKRFETIANTIAMECFPGAKNPKELAGRYDQSFVQKNSLIAFAKRQVILQYHEKNTNKMIEKRLDELTKNRSEVEKDLVKFALESQVNETIPKRVRDFLKDVPDAYKEIVGIDEENLFAKGDNEKVFFRDSTAEHYQQVLAKYAVYKMIADDLKSGNFDSKMIQAIKNGEGDKLVDALRVSETFQSMLRKESDLKSLLEDSAKQTKTYFSVFDRYLKMHMTNQYAYNAELAKKNIESARNIKNVDLESELKKRSAEDEKKAADTAKAKQHAKEAVAERENVCKRILTSERVSFNQSQLEQVADAYAAEFKANTSSVNAFVNWKVFSAAVQYAQKSNCLVTKNSIERAMKDCEERLDQSPEFKKKLEAGTLKNVDAADFEFYLAKPEKKVEKNPAEEKQEEANKQQEQAAFRNTI